MACAYNQVDDLKTSPYDNKAALIPPGGKTTLTCDDKYVTYEFWKGEQTFNKCMVQARYMSLQIINLMTMTLKLGDIGGNPITTMGQNMVVDSVGGGDLGTICSNWNLQGKPPARTKGEYLVHPTATSLASLTTGNLCPGWQGTQGDTLSLGNHYAPFQKWSFNSPKFHNAQSNLCLDVAGDGRSVTIWHCRDATVAPYQVWSQKGDHLYNEKSGKCLDVASNTPGGAVVIFNCGQVDAPL